MITLTAFRQVPPFARGLVRDLRVRWALEEAGTPYRIRLIGQEDQPSAAYRALQPFGQVPAIEDGDLRLFESGAILLHVGAGCDTLLPSEPIARARATAWVFAALNSMEPAIQNLVAIDLFYANEEWAKARRPGAEEFARARLRDLDTWLGDKSYLEGRFTAGDLMMVTVLRLLRHTTMVAEFPRLKAYQERCEARPAFAKSLADQMAVFEAAAA
jgi:glutathione S-transferase